MRTLKERKPSVIPHDISVELRKIVGSAEQKFAKGE